MKQRFYLSETEDIGKSLGVFLKFLESDKMFSYLFQRQPTERFAEQFLRYNSPSLITEEDLITYYKGVLEDHNQRLEIRDKLLRYGETRLEILSNLKALVLGTPKLLQSYKELLKKKSGYDDKESVIELRVDRDNKRGNIFSLENRLNPKENGPNTTNRTSIYTGIKMQELDTKYLNILGGNN